MSMFDDFLLLLQIRNENEDKEKNKTFKTNKILEREVLETNYSNFDINSN